MGAWVGPLWVSNVEERYVVWLGTPEQPGRMYWCPPDEAKAQEIVQTLAERGVAAFYTPAVREVPHDGA